MKDKKVILFMNALLATCAMHSSSSVITDEEILNVLNLNYLNVINVSKLEYKFDYFLSVFFTRLKLNYMSCYGMILSDIYGYNYKSYSFLALK